MAKRYRAVFQTVVLVGCLAGRATGAPEAAAELSDLSRPIQALLGAADPARRIEAIDGLSALPPRLALPYLVKLLRDPDPQVRTKAAQTVGPFSSLTALPALLAGLRDADAAMRAACASSLGQLGALSTEDKERALLHLSRGLGDSQYAVRQQALRAIERWISQNVLSELDLGRILPAVLLASEDENVGVRKTAVGVLSRASRLPCGKPCRDRLLLGLLSRLSDPAREVRAESLQGLGHLGVPDAAQAALRLLNDPHEDVRRQALLCLGRLGFVQALPVFEQTLLDGPETLRSAALLGLWHLLHKRDDLPEEDLTRVLRLLLRYSDGTRPQVWAGFSQVDRAAKAAGQSPSQSAPASQGASPGGMAKPLAARLSVVLLQQMSHPGQNVREQTAWVEFARDVGPAFPALAQRDLEQVLLRLFSQQAVPRETVLEALAQVGGVDTTALLASLLTDPETEVRRKAAQLLDQPHRIDARAAQALKKAFRQTGAKGHDAVVARHALHALGRLGLEQDTLVLALSQETDPENRLVAAHALANIAGLGRLTEQSGQTLHELLFSGLRTPPKIKRACAEALAAHAARHPEKRNLWIGEVLSELRKAPWSPGCHREVLLLLALLLRNGTSDAAQDRLLALAQGAGEPGSAEQALALDALGALHSFVSPSAQKRLIALLGHPDPLRVLRATSLLGVVLAKAPSEPVLAALLGVLADPADPRLVAEAAWALSNLSRNHPAVASLVNTLRDLLSAPRTALPERAAIRANVLAALCRLGHARPQDMQWLSDSEPAVRQNAALLAGSLVPRDEVIVELRNLARLDDDQHVRKNAEAAELGRGAHGLTVRTHWLVTYQTDFDGKPRQVAPYRLVLGDGLARVGYTDFTGGTVDELLPEGNCEVGFLAEARPQ